MDPVRNADAEDVGELYAISVDPSWRGSGVGRALIGEARRLRRRAHDRRVATSSHAGPPTSLDNRFPFIEKPSCRGISLSAGQIGR